MKVILKEEVTRVGKPGDIVQVSDGFARNYLFPQKKAIPATEINIKNIEQYKKGLLKKEEAQRTNLEELAKSLSQLECVIEKKKGKNNKLFGSVTAQDIYKSILDKGFHVDKRNIQLETPIKEIGEFPVGIRLKQGIEATVKVIIK